MRSHLLSIITLILIALAATGCGQHSSQAAVQVDQAELKEIINRGFADDWDGAEYLLKHAARVDEAALQRAGVSIPYAKLTSSPLDYRGLPITIQGILWRLYELPTNSKSDFRHLYEAWIVSDEKQAYRVVCSQLPADLQPGHKLRNVQVTGYFLGLEEYETWEIWEWKLINAPTFLARCLVVTGNHAVPTDFRVNYSTDGFSNRGCGLPNINVGLESDKSGKLSKLTLTGNNLGRDDAAFARLNAEILKIIGRPGNPLTKHIWVVINADFECDYKFVVKAVASCAGRQHPETKQQIPYVENIKFMVPRVPKQ